MVRGFYVAASLDKDTYAIESKIKRTKMVLIEIYVGVALGMENLDGANYARDECYQYIPIQKEEVAKMFCRGELKSKDLNSYGKLVQICVSTYYHF